MIKYTEGACKIPGYRKYYCDSPVTSFYPFFLCCSFSLIIVVVVVSTTVDVVVTVAVVVVVVCVVVIVMAGPTGIGNAGRIETSSPCCFSLVSVSIFASIQ